MIRFGVLGTARIARQFLGDPLKNVSIVAVASRDQGRADAYAREYGIPRAYGNYEKLLNDPAIEAVYIPLPQHLHCEYTVKAARAGKHVLVEKPSALTVAELHQMVTACKNHHVLFMEAFMYRFMPIHRRVKEIVASGLLGRLRYIDFNWCFNVKKLVRSPYRLDKSAGGGALYDLGIYGVEFLRFITEGTPSLVSAYTAYAGPDGLDVFTHAACQVNDVFGAITCGYTSDANYYVVSGELGSLVVPGSVSGQFVEKAIQVHLHEADKRYEERFAPMNPYRLEMEYFADCIEKGTRPFLDGENSLWDLEFLEEIFRRSVRLELQSVMPEPS